MHEEDGILTNDVRGVIRPALKDLKVAIVRRTQELRQASGFSLLIVFCPPSSALVAQNGVLVHYYYFL